MSQSITAYTQFVKPSGSQSVPATSLTVLYNVWQTAISGGTSSKIVSGATAGELTGEGVYQAQYTGDLTTYVYLFSFYTTDTSVSQVRIPAVGYDGAQTINKTSAGVVSEVALTDNTAQVGGSSLVQTSGKIWALNDSGNSLASASGLSTLQTTANTINATTTTNLDTNVGSRAPSSTALSTATWTNTRAGYLDTLNGIVAAITSAVWGAATRTLTALGINVTVGGYASGQDPATLVLDIPSSGHNSSGTIGAKINTAGSAADPLLNNVPGSYAAGTAGAALGKIGSALVTVVSPIDSTGVITIQAGDDYQSAEGRTILFTQSGPGWPSTLSGGSSTFFIYGLSAGTFSQAGVTIVATPPGQQIGIPLAATNTSTWARGSYDYALIFTNAAGHTQTLQTGSLTVTGEGSNSGEAPT